ncbi:MAG TPA: hypothetical protein VL282_05830 [Tepidisphaeraceae bacterium]|nr:hypothetical protein [Tepidisphaeraceae bacterium]
MHVRSWLVGMCAIGGLLSSQIAHAAPAQNAKLVYDVAALERLQQLDVSAEQLRAIDKLAVGVKPQALPDKMKLTDEYRSALSEYRKAMISGDEDKISTAEDKVGEIKEKNEDSPDAEIDATESARHAAPELLSLLRPSQIAGYVSEHSDDVPDPLQTMLDALDEIQGKDGDDYTSVKEEASDQVALLLAGLDPAAQAPIAKKVGDWIDSAHKLSADELKTKHASLEASAKEIVKQPDPIQCLRNWLLRDLADLLANPQLHDVITARLKGS